MNKTNSAVRVLERVLAIDPGRDKCGVAVVDLQGQMLEHRIIARRKIMVALPPLIAQYEINEIVLGDATTSRALHTELKRDLPETPVHIINETGSTLEARAVYWQANPPRGWRKILPLSLQIPPVPIDDFAAVVLARRFFHARETNNEPGA
jgi:RNase H-fold protein (predicted Holliday junction resolvase)